MMKILTIAMLAALGCGGGKKAEPTGPGDTTAQPPAASAGVSCAQDIARVCDNGMVDGCTGGKTTVHVCIAPTEEPGPPCAQEIAKVCPEGQIDACLVNPIPAETHICVAK